MQPIFSLSDSFDDAIEIGADTLPVHVKRYSRAEMDAFEKQWDTYVKERGAVERTADEQAAFEAAQLRFFEDTIREAITVDAGYIVDRGKPVADGAGLIGVFHSRKEVLAAFVFAVYRCNRLGTVIRKNLSSPRVSAPGSEASIPARGGDGQGPIATAAESSGSAPSAAAMDESAARPDASASSGDLPKVH